VSGDEVLSSALFVVGAAFFLAGTVGLLRFPDVFSRLHALAKADNLGLGFVVAGLALQAESAAEVAKLVMIWGLVLASSAISCQLIARAARRSSSRPEAERGR
jgi:multicomponent Na+:H+ antiporter subunit G